MREGCEDGELQEKATILVCIFCCAALEDLDGTRQTTARAFVDNAACALSEFGHKGQFIKNQLM